MKSKIFTATIFLLVILTVCLWAKPIKNYLRNYSLNYDKYVYLGGDNIVIDYKMTTDKTSVGADIEYATIGTITYIDSKGNYGAVAHKISDNNITSGNIYNIPVDSVIKSNKDKIGEKNVIMNETSASGNITIMNETGIYGKYNINDQKRILLKVAMPIEIKRDQAFVYTVISDNKIEAYEIEIVKIFLGRKTHNIYFKINDERLLEKTGGVIKGMSGSPIVQKGQIIGAVSHVEDSDPTYGYGLFITYMIGE